jgi:hypothetical protein
MSFTWPILDPRMDRERVVRIAYLAAKLGYFWVADAGFMFFHRPNTARLYVASIARRGILDAFPRRNPSDPHAYRISERGLEWLVGEIGCDRNELWRPSSTRRLNIPAVRAMNRFWCSLASAAAEHPQVRLHRFVPERQLRRMKSASCSVVPDAIAIMRVAMSDSADAPAKLVAVAVEQDSGCERLKVWSEKTRGYANAKRSPAFYGHPSGEFVLLAIVPSHRRAVNVARTVAMAAGGSFTYLGLAHELERGHALDAVLWNAAILGANPLAKPNSSLVSVAQTSISSTSATPIRPDGLPEHFIGVIP